MVTERELAELCKNGQIFSQYVDLDGNPSMDSRYNPNGSVNAIEGLTSKNGQIIGKMGHSERFEEGLFQNIPVIRINGYSEVRCIILEETMWVLTELGYSLVIAKIAAIIAQPSC